MTALTAERDTSRRQGNIFSDPVAADVKCFMGGLGVLDAAGNLKPGITATNLTARGMFRKTADNSGGAAGDQNAETEAGTFLFGNSAAADEIVRADIGADCYIVDDQTVAKTNGGGTRSVAGRVVDIDSNVWINIRGY